MIIDLGEYLLDDQEAAAPDLLRYAESKGLKDIRVFTSTNKETKSKSYLLVKGETPIFESQQSEAVAVHIDVLWLVEKD